MRFRFAMTMCSAGTSQEYRSKPFDQQLGALKVGASSHRGLSLTGLALVQTAVPEAIRLVIAAIRTHEAVQPPITPKFANAGLSLANSLTTKENRTENVA